jgi:hypothetical protein
MKVIVATRTSQHDEERDFSWTVDGELVHLPGLECCDAAGCGCGLSFCGVASHRATTTAEVADRPLQRIEVIAAVAESLVDAGWFTDAEDDDTLATALDLVAPLLVAADRLPVGTIVRRNRDRLYAQLAPEHA